MLAHCSFCFFVENRLKNVRYSTTEKVFTDPKVSWSIETFKEYFQTDTLKIERTPDVIEIWYSLPYTPKIGEFPLPEFVDDDMSGNTDVKSPDNFPPSRFFKNYVMEIYPETFVKSHTCEFEFLKKPIFLIGLLEMFALTACVVFYIRKYCTITPIMAFYLLSFVAVVISAVVSAYIAIGMLSSVDNYVCRQASPQQTKYIFGSTKFMTIFGIGLVVISLSFASMQLYVLSSINRGPASIPVADAPAFGRSTARTPTSTNAGDVVVDVDADIGPSGLNESHV